MRTRSVSTRRWAPTFALASLAALLWPSPAETGLNVWTSTGPPAPLPSTRTVAIDPLAPGTIYAGTALHGVFKSVDGGASWAAINTGLGNLRVFAMAVDPLASRTLYLGTAILGGASDGMLKSVDAGANWVPINAGLSTSRIHTIAVDPKTPGTVYAGVIGGVFKSTDGGAHWANKSLDLSGVIAFALAFSPETPSVLYAGTEGGGVSKSTDGAESWTRFDIGLTDENVQALAIHPQIPTTIYAGTNGGGVFRSTTGGGNWVAMNAGLTNTEVISLAIDPQNPATLYAGTFGGGVFKSTDGGSSWAPLNAGFSGIDQVPMLAITRSGACLHAATNGGHFELRTESGACTPPAVAAAVLPSSRSALTGVAATAFATIINPMDAVAKGCRIAPLASPPHAFSFQTTDPATNQLVGTPDAPADIPAGGLQTYVISLTPTAPFPATDIQLDFGCVNTASALVIVGVNTLLLSASATPVPDIVALAAAQAGIVNLVSPVPAGAATEAAVGAFAVATVNVGAAGLITASADDGGAGLPITLAICRTDPAVGNCISGVGSSVTVQINAGETPTFGVFVASEGVVPFDAAVNRVFVRFKDAGGNTRGSTSVAARTQ